MTNLVLDAYSRVIEIVLWVIVACSGIGAFFFYTINYSPSTDGQGWALALVVGIAGLGAGFLFCVLFLAPLILLANIRDQLKNVGDDTSHMSEKLKRIR
jgi:hypothetical protein